MATVSASSTKYMGFGLQIAFTGFIWSSEQRVSTLSVLICPINVHSFIQVINTRMTLGNLGGKTDCKFSVGKRQRIRRGNQATGEKGIVREGTKHRLPDTDTANFFNSPPVLFLSGLHLQQE